MTTWLDVFVTSICTTYILTNANIFEFPRYYLKPLRCSLCTGFWVGAFLAAVTTPMFLESWGALLSVYSMAVCTSVGSLLTEKLINFTIDIVE